MSGKLPREFLVYLGKTLADFREVGYGLDRLKFDAKRTDGVTDSD